jgi:hypothetical protein
MKGLAVLLALAVPLTFAAASAGASTPAGTQSPPGPPTQPQLSKPVPVGAAATSSPNSSLTYQVKDEKGVLLTCIAPQIDSNPDTDIFSGCTLAQGRTLDDVMHTFIQAIHFVQNEHAKERAELLKEMEDKQAQKAEQK